MKTILVFGFVAGAIALDCDAGWKHKTTLTNLHCDTAAVSADSCNDNCCVKDVLKCGGQVSNLCTATAADGKYSIGYGLSGTALANAANKATTAATLKADCCLDRATCASTTYTCPAGYKKATGADNTKCPTDAASCGTSTSGCCVKDDTKCGGLMLQMADCTGSTYYPTTTTDTWKNKVATGADAAAKKASCCETKAKCSAATCPGGYKKITTAGTDALDCTSDAASCAPTYAETVTLSASTCCEKDVTKCGGLSVTCATGKYNHGSGTTKTNAWKIVTAAEGTKLTDCCTTIAKCATYTCPAGMKDKATKATIDCASDADSCTSSTCCDVNPLTCGGNNIAATTCTATTHKAKCASDTSSCTSASSDTTFKTSCKAAEATCYGTVTTATALATADGVCCEKLATCTEFKAKVASANTLVSGTYQFRPVLTMAMAVIAFLSMWQQ